MEETRWRDKGLYCCFVDFKKAIVMVPYEYFWRFMEELEILSEYMLSISRIHAKVKYVVCIWAMEIYIFFPINTIGVKQGCLLSHELYFVYALIN